MAKHLERKSNEIVFKRCANPRCKHCVDKPIVSVKAWNYLKERNFKWSNPVSSSTHPGHYQTFAETEQLDPQFIKTGNSFKVLNA